MPAMIAASKGKPSDKAMRTALRQWGFNTKRRADCPEDTAVILSWLSRNTKPVAALADPAVMRAVLGAAGNTAQWPAQRLRGPPGPTAPS